MKEKKPNVEKKKEQTQEEISYMPFFMCIGLSIGVGLGALLDNIPSFMCIGMSIGLAIGAGMDAANRKKAEENAKKDDEDVQ